MRLRFAGCGVLLALAVAACATSPQRAHGVLPPTQATASTYVLVGEVHDHPLHHRRQAELLQAMVAAGRKPAVVMEHLTPTQGELVNTVRKQDGKLGAVSQAVEWAATGWPPFAIFRPVFAAIFEHDLTVYGAAVAASEALAHSTPVTLPPTLQRTLLKELAEAHCGMEIPEDRLGAMARVQIERDRAMAEALIAADNGDGAVLLAGNGHVRRDRGVPWHLRQRVPERTNRSIGQLEQPVTSDRRALFDEVWLSPSHPRPDPCRNMPRLQSKGS